MFSINSPLELKDNLKRDSTLWSQTMRSQNLTVSTAQRQVPLRLLCRNIKALGGTDGAFPAFPYETVFLAGVFKPSHLPFSISPLLNVPLELFLHQLKRKRNNRKEKMTAWCSCMPRLAEWLVPHWPPHLHNGLRTEICSLRFEGTNPESQHFWVSGHMPAVLRGLHADDALCNGCKGSPL